ncbi:MAG: AraC family transcriptional regulator [Chitinophagales bacterium]|nr:AraC family transcriptional regulator [Chitinophagales bacterium]
MAFLYNVTLVFIYLSILLSIFLLTTKSKNRQGNIFLAVFIILRAIDASAIVYLRYIDVHPVIEILRHDIAGLVSPPFLYLFICSIVYSDFRLHHKDLLHIFPFLMVVIVSLPRVYFPILGATIFESLPENIFDRFEARFTYAIASIQTLGYIIATYILLSAYRKKFLENYSSSVLYNYNWLMVLNSITLFLFLTATIKNIYKFNYDNNSLLYLRISVLLIMLFLISWMVLKALYSPGIFAGIDSSLRLVGTRPVVRNAADKPEIIEKIATLDRYMKEYEPYLNPKLTIAQLAREMKWETKDLSSLINNYSGKNFYEFVSEYRINKAKEILQTPSEAHYTILEILYRVGYNSKSSFNTAFKKQTGLTPTAYRKKHKSV